jgi:DNA repair photolyase
MAEREGLSLSITTKSNQVVRDLDLLQKISRRSSLSVNLTVTTVRTRLARLLEPRAPRPDLRLDAVRQLREAGIATGVFAMPVLPGLTDRERDLGDLVRGAQQAGAQWFAANILFLMPAAMRQFLPFLEEKFPRLVERYRAWYGSNGNAPESYRREIAERVERLRQKYELASRPPRPSPESWKSRQMQLTWGNGESRCHA